MANSTSDEEIIEKRPSHPVATSCLILASVAILGALVFQIGEISQVRAKMTGPERNSNEPYKVLKNQITKDFNGKVDGVIASNDHPELTPAAAMEGKPGAGAAGAAPPVEKTETPPAAAAEPAPADATPADATEKTEAEPAPPAGGADEKAGDKPESAGETPAPPEEPAPAEPKEPAGGEK